MREYQRYDEYKDSGVEWIGKIPTGWKKSKLKFHIDFSNGYAFHSDDYRIDGKKIVRMGNIGIDCRFKKFNFKYCEYGLYKKLSNYHLKKGDLIISMTDITPDKNLIGKTAIIDDDNKYILNQRVGRIRIVSDRLITKYLYFYTNSSAYTKGIKSIAYGSVQFNASVDDLIDYFMYLPSLNEQQKIASFLDKKTAEIDEIINKKESLIEKLENYKKSVITEAVTKGKLGDKYINEDGELVDEIEMKDSGVEWLGEVPYYTDIRKLKYLAEQINNKWDEKNHYKYIGLENIESNGGKLISTQSSKEISSAIKFKKHDILFNTLRPYLRKCIVAEFNGICSSELLVLRTKKLLPNIISYIMLSNKFIELVNSSTYGAKMPRANWDFIGNIFIPKFNKIIQNKILTYLKKKTNEIDTLIQNTKESTEKYKDYKKSLIFEAVTGKIDLRDYQLEEV